jgi:hypothetical protein
MIKKRYSRLTRVEERKNIKQAIFYSLLTIGIVVGFIFFGIPALAKFAGFLTDLKKSSQPVEINDTTPPAPPTLDLVPKYTNKETFEITGKTESGATVILFLNNDKEEILANKEGEFSYTFKLNRGENSFSAKAKDAAGNESQKSKVYKIIFDDEPPVLEILSPDNDKEFYGPKERQIIIKGKTEDGASVFVNERVVAVEEDGSFSFMTTLSEGENTFTIKATDPAGNSIEKSLTSFYTP